MKKILLPIAIFMVVTSFGQTTIRLGVSGGPNYTFSQNGALGFEAGGLIESSFNKPEAKLKLQLEVRYSNINTNTENYKIDAQQIDMPLLAKYFITPSLSINAGTIFDFNLSTRADGLKVYMQAKNESNNFQADMVAGFTYYLKHNLFLDFRYNNLFGKYNGSLDANSFANSFQYRLNNIQIGLGIRFAPLITDFVE